MMHTHAYSPQYFVWDETWKSHTSTLSAIKCCLGWRVFAKRLCVRVCLGAQSSDKWIQSLGKLQVSLKAPCPCCDIIYECHNWGSVNCRFSPLSVTPCVNTEVQGDGVDQYFETGAIRWIYSPVTRELWNNAAVAFSKLLDGTAVLLAHMYTPDPLGNSVFLFFRL